MVAYGKDNFSRGICLSILGHALLVYLVLFKFVPGNELANPVIYSVTVEGGKELGGLSQVAKTEKAVLAPPKKTANAKAPELKPPEVKKSSEVKPAPESTPAKDEVSLAERKPTPVSTKEPKVKPTPVKKEPKKKPEKPDTADADKDYLKALQRYQGESTDAGGKNFGAGKLGGKGMGGGELRPPEFFTYRDLIKAQIKRGWRWYDLNANLVTWVIFEIASNGEISGVRVAQSSGNPEFDASVVRAINKASPLPAPPENVYQFFKSVRMSFDPRE